MRSFRFYATYEPNPVTRYVSEYSGSELAEFQSRFATDLERRRKALFLLALYAIAWVAATFGGRFIFGFDSVTTYAIHGFAVLGLMTIAGVWGTPRCPACQNEIDRCIGGFCPECGSTELNRDQWLYVHCDSCHRRLERLQKPTYVTKFCSHCGIRLCCDQHGTISQEELDSSRAD